MAESVFEEAIAEIAKFTLEEKDYPVIWGGEFRDTDLGPFLAVWKDDGRCMPWRLWEWVSDIKLEFGDVELPQDLQWLERGELFGSGGHLSVRRDGERFRWRYVGPPKSELPQGLLPEPEGGVPASSEGGQPLYAVPCLLQAVGESMQRYEGQRRLLWGKKAADGDPIWLEDRVAGGKKRLRYPGLSSLKKDARVYLVYSQYLRGDCLEAVWWQRLEGWEVQNG